MLAGHGYIVAVPEIWGHLFIGRTKLGVSMIKHMSGASIMGLERAEIDGGRYAVLRHKGPYADMKAAYRWLFGEWLTSSGEEAADAPVFEEYLNSPRDTPPVELRTEGREQPLTTTATISPQGPVLGTRVCTSSAIEATPAK